MTAGGSGQQSSIRYEADEKPPTALATWVFLPDLSPVAVPTRLPEVHRDQRPQHQVRGHDQMPEPGTFRTQLKCVPPMSRPKKFNVDEVLMKAVELFWRQGYKATTVQDLVDHLGIGRSSLYATFGGKRALFLRALRHYDQVFREEAVAEIARSSKSPRQAIKRIFRMASAAILEDGSRDGCLLINTALELSPHDCASEEIVRRAFTGMEGFFRTMIERGQASGEILYD